MNGYKNWETYVFVLHYEDYIREVCQEKANEGEINSLKDVISYIDDILDEIQYKTEGDSFIEEVISATIEEIDKMTVAENIYDELQYEKIK